MTDEVYPVHQFPPPIVTPGGGGTVTSVGLGLPGEFTVTGSPVTIAGTLAATWASQLQNLVFASPNGGPGTPSFRALVAADIPALPYGTGTVTSVGLSLPSELTVSGSPVTVSGSLAAVWASETQHFVFAAPSGSSGTPGFRALVAGDIPALPYGTGTVTSVGLSLPAELTVSGSPVTVSGSLAATWASEAQNLVFASPNGSAGTPSFRALVAADIPALPYGTGTVTSIATTAPVTGGTITTTGTIAVSDFVGSGASHARGTVPDPGASAGTTKFLCEDATFKAVPAGAGGAMTQIAKVVTTGSASTITFSSIPGTYTNLKIFIQGRDTATGSGTASVRLMVNGDTTAANYSTGQTLLGNNTTASASQPASTTTGVACCQLPGTTSSANAVGQGEVTINNYAGTAFWKTVVGVSHEMVDDSPTNNQVGLFAFTWKNTAAITNLVLTAGVTAFVDGTTAVLYGLS